MNVKHAAVNPRATLHGDYTTSQELNEALKENVEQFYIDYAGGTYEMKIVKY